MSTTFKRPEIPKSKCTLQPSSSTHAIEDLTMQNHLQLLSKFSLYWVETITTNQRETVFLWRRLHPNRTKDPG